MTPEARTLFGVLFILFGIVSIVRRRQAAEKMFRVWPPPGTASPNALTWQPVVWGIAFILMGIVLLIPWS